MKYIVGLGNPGPEYKTTKHNIGFMVLRELAKENSIEIDGESPVYSSGMGRIGSEEVTLVLPQTYMNNSGQAVGDLVRDKVNSIDDLIVVCDDINLKLGRIRLRKKGSSGGHKGLASIIDMLGRGDFARMRVGIATEAHKGDITNFVLTPFKRRDRKHISHVISLAEEALAYWTKNGIEKAMTRFNTRKVGTS